MASSIKDNEKKNIMIELSHKLNDTVNKLKQVGYKVPLKMNKQQ